MDILNPPESYIAWRCATHAWELNTQNTKEQFDSIRKKFYDSKQHQGQEAPILEFCNWLNKAQQDFTLPFEKLEIRQSDGKKHGKVQSMMIYDIQYWIEKGQLKHKRIYMI